STLKSQAPENPPMAAHQRAAWRQSAWASELCASMSPAPLTIPRATAILVASERREARTMKPLLRQSAARRPGPWRPAVMGKPPPRHDMLFTISCRAQAPPQAARHTDMAAQAEAVKQKSISMSVGLLDHYNVSTRNLAATVR